MHLFCYTSAQRILRFSIFCLMAWKYESRRFAAQVADISHHQHRGLRDPQFIARLLNHCCVFCFFVENAFAFFVFLFFKCVFKRRHFSRFHFVFFSLKVKAKSDVLTSHLWNISFWFLWTDSELVCQIKYLPIQMTYKANIKGRFKGPASENTLNHAVRALIHPFIWNFSWGPYLNTEKLI